jgi:hypothetical protein
MWVLFFLVVSCVCAVLFHHQLELQPLMIAAQFMAYGWLNFGRNGFLRGLERVPEDLAKVDLKGRTVLITGGNAGLGFESVKALASCGAKVFMVANFSFCFVFFSSSSPLLQRLFGRWSEELRRSSQSGLLPTCMC